MPGPFTYLATIPQPGDLLSSSQPQILTNFASLKSLIDVDHVDFNSSNAGKHNTVTFPITSPASPTFGTTEYALFNESDGTYNQLWLNNPANLHFTQVPMAASIFNSVINPLTLSSGYSLLPSGFTIQWGAFTAQPTGTTISFNVTFAARVVIVLVSPYAPTTVAISSGTYTASNFVIAFSGGGTASGTFFAIGY